MSTSPSVVDVNDENTLQRGLTSAQVSMIGLSGALGTGLFLGSGSMIGVAGPGVILSYTLTGLLSLVIVWCLAEMTVLHPVAGGFGAIAHAYLGPIGGWLMRWNAAIVLCIAVGAEVVACVIAEAFDYLDAPPLRVHQEDVPLPYAANLEVLSLPGVDKIVAAVKQVMA